MHRNPVNVPFRYSKRRYTLLIFIIIFYGVMSIKAHDDVDPTHPGAVRDFGYVRNLDLVRGDVLYPASLLKVEVMMLRSVRIEIRTSRVDNDLPQEPDLDKLMKGVVDGRQGHFDRRSNGFFVQLLGRDVPITVFEQQTRQRQTLPGRPKIRATQQVERSAEGAVRAHGFDMATNSGAGNQIGRTRQPKRLHAPAVLPRDISLSRPEPPAHNLNHLAAGIA